MNPTVFLMYHELESPARALCHTDPGYLRYVITEQDFRAQMQWLRSAGWSGVCVTKALDHAGNQRVALTFDDGCETDLLTAAPLLKEMQFSATFYITTGFLGQKGYLSILQLRELSMLGFEIGCHSHSHAFLSDLNDEGLKREMSTPKRYLEDLLGRSVDHFSCPGGRYNARVQEMAKQVTYRTLTTSRAHANRLSTNSYQLGRIAILRDTSLDSFARICRAEGLPRLRALQVLSAVVKKGLGNNRYSSLHSWMHRKPFQH